MLIPNSFKNAIKGAFYDKTVTLLGSSTVKDAVGWTKKDDSASTGTFKGNVRFAKLDRLQQEYGLEEQIDIAITTDQNIPLEQLISYNGKKYMIFRSMPFDSHYLLFGKKWLSRS